MRAIRITSCAAALAAGVAAGCGQGSEGKGAVQARSAASAASVRCTDEGIAVVTPIVRQRADGIHLLIDNATGKAMVLNYEVDEGEGGGGDTILPPGQSMHVVRLAGSSLGVNCIDQESDANTLDFALAYEEIEVRGGAARPAKLGCRDVDVSEIDAGVIGLDPVALGRRFLRSRGQLERADVVQRATSGPESPIVRVVRRGRVVAPLWFQPVRAESVELELYALEACHTF